MESIEVLKDKEGLIREQNEAAMLHPVDEVSVLIESLKDQNWQIRLGAVWALGEMGDKRAVIFLKKLLSDEIAMVQKAAQEALSKM